MTDPQPDVLTEVIREAPCIHDTDITFIGVPFCGPPECASAAIRHAIDEGRLSLEALGAEKVGSWGPVQTSVHVHGSRPQPWIHAECVPVFVAPQKKEKE